MVCVSSYLAGTMGMLNKFVEKLSDLEMKRAKIQQRQDTIDELALDTLFKMEILLAKMRGVVQNLEGANEMGNFC